MQLNLNGFLFISCFYFQSSTIGGLKSFPRNRKETSKSSGYGSELQALESEEEKTISRSPLDQSVKDEKSAEDKRSVFCQTDFSSDEGVAEKKSEKSDNEKKLLSPTVPSIAKDTLPKEIANFCWRHDSVYDKLVFPPARPTSASSTGDQVQIRQSSSKKN